MGQHVQCQAFLHNLNLTPAGGDFPFHVWPRSVPLEKYLDHHAVLPCEFLDVLIIFLGVYIYIYYT